MRLIPVLLLIFGISVYAQQKTAYDYVDPMIGTQRMGHVYPGATVPFGMVQLSPDTDTIPYSVDGRYNPDVYKYCAGYQYGDKTIVGFSHTHFSGTGHSDLGDFLIMPTQGPLQLNPGIASNPKSGYRSGFSHATEMARPGYYKVDLADHDITAEMTASERVGVHRYTFHKAGLSHIILDLMHGIYNYDDKNIWTFVQVKDDYTVVGYRQTKGWARTRLVYFAMQFSKPIKNYGCVNYDKREVYRGFWGKFDQEHNFPELAGKKLRVYFDFDMAQDEALEIQVALSAVGTEGAMANLGGETSGKNFDEIMQEAKASWDKELNKITMTGTEEDKVNFYTALYHTLLSPIIYQDIDGKYRGLDQNIHQARGFKNYTIFSLWDTYRALHPLFNIIQPQRNRDMIRSMLAHYNQSAMQMLPVWSHYANENWCMIGYHSVSVIADAIIKDEYRGDANAALDACVKTARNRKYEGLAYYMDLGFIPEDKSSSSVSKVLEYAYDDWCIMKMAEKLGRLDIQQEFGKRSGNFRNVFDPTTGFMRPKMSDGKFKKEFDPMDTHGQGFIEGNAWNYSLYVPHDVPGLIQLLGNKGRFEQYLDQLFGKDLPDKYFEKTEDITREGIIGNYVHGNEPSHHVAYLYNWTDSPWKTQQKVRMILKNQYRNGPDGLSGNDDCGQMSAWYLFSSIGFYPVCPGSDQYMLGSPLVESATIRLENGNIFSVKTINQAPDNVYVKSITWKGFPWKERYITHEMIKNGGELVFEMSAKP
ncbi:MAG: GH92 family glycosyl hydrolase [Saprospiraceae bacterium]|jgi:predicted alpha-1,2-mannosidase|nr:GH92 family glycosyl hydrolase [Saprospiraceae bacterium]MBX7178554.1 GH92 family glycosyl hydrolase [Saprospiraceae bacterium]MCB0590117.1 GH92 family glycosyl hydrolase [Saprospiraceae bacterium]MCO5284243.1 GH92 family glycosyl hydrolase [Saprospiraceae bacterium]MCO6469942.1 GH92 family glycosyl hydrolase [Saprospiraceae bacterium]